MTAAGIGIIKTIVNRSKLMVVWAAALLTVPAWTADIQADGVPNIHRVNQHLYRGGQPADAGWASLAKLGVKVVVDPFFPTHELPTRKCGDRQRSFRAVGLEHPRGVLARGNSKPVTTFPSGEFGGWKNGRAWRGSNRRRSTLRA